MGTDRLAGFDPLASFTGSPVARLATASPDGTPHLIPVVFAFGSDGGDSVIYTAVDAKPKTTRRLRRLANIDDNPQVCLLVDHYTDDWTRLWWVRVDGVAAVHHDGDAMTAGQRLLRAKYPQYLSVPIDGPVIAVTGLRWSSWHA